MLLECSPAFGDGTVVRSVQRIIMEEDGKQNAVVMKRKFVIMCVDAFRDGFG